MSIEEAIRSINYGLKMETTDAPFVRQMTIVRTDALQVALAVLRTQQERERNEPLTLDELRNMDGEPVYVVVLYAKTAWWAVVRTVTSEKLTTDYGGWFDMTEYGKTWLAYRHKPKEEMA